MKVNRPASGHPFAYRFGRDGWLRLCEQGPHAGGN
jgi:hypothetical protein